MKNLKDILLETYEDGVFDKAVPKREAKKIQQKIYKYLDKTKVTGRFYHDQGWAGVDAVRKDVGDALEAINPGKYELIITKDNPDYRKSKDGLSQWKQYKVEIYVKDHKDPFIMGTLNCHAAGSIEYPFDTYDMSFCISY